MTETAREALLRRSKEGGESADTPKKSARELLADRAAGKTFEVPRPKTPVSTAPPTFFERFKRAAFSSPESILAEDPNASVEGVANAGIGAGEAAAATATGIPASLAGGVNMTASLLGGRGVDNSLARMQETQQALTYQPRTDQGQQALGGVSEVMGAPAAAGRWAGDKAADMGAPAWLSAGLATAPDAGLMLAGGKALKSEPTIRPAIERPKAIVNADENHAFAGESASASAVAPDLTKLSPPVREKFERILATGGKVDKEAFNRVAEADSLGIQLSEGQAKLDPDLISKENNARAKEQTAARYQLQNQQLIDKLDEFRAEASPNAVGNDHIQNGQSLIDSYKAADEPVRADISAKYKALEQANGGQFPVDGGAFVNAADAALKSKMKGRYVPAAIEGDLAEFRNTGAMTYEQFENLRTNLAAEARKAERSGDGNAAHAVSLVREALESLPMTGEAANIKPLADAARNAAKARFDRLKADPAYRAAVDDSVPAGEASPLADDFVNKYVIKGKSANIAKMRENLGGDPQAAETISAGVMNYLKSKAGVNLYTNEGNFSQAGFNRALSEVTPKIKTLVPETTAEKLQKLGNVARYTQVQPRGSYVNNSNTFTAAAGEMVGGKLELAGNAMLPGANLGTTVRGKLAERSAKKAADKAWEPGAGLEAKPQKLNDLMKGKKK